MSAIDGTEEAEVDKGRSKGKGKGRSRGNTRMEWADWGGEWAFLVAPCPKHTDENDKATDGLPLL